MARRRVVTVLGLGLAFLLGAYAAHFMWGGEGIAQANNGDDVAKIPLRGPFPGKCDVDLAITKEGLKVTLTPHAEFYGAYAITCTGLAGQPRVFYEEIFFPKGAVEHAVKLEQFRSLWLDDLGQRGLGYVRLEFYEKEPNQKTLVFRGAYLIHTGPVLSSGGEGDAQHLGVSYLPAPGSG